MATIVALHAHPDHAHPDDEVLLTGGTLARAAADFHHRCSVCSSVASGSSTARPVTKFSQH
ncbi:PIG-L family deacetylase [Saccharothrix deserti]|uniref:PIG-L family deacetylase n=1 Tax=Saccharothrix deserti TaxID=2593674 RepID=UPI00131B4D89|nr:PIG-L family deacetylase [Saccharothrix deserti]